MKKIVIVTVNYNSENETNALLESLQHVDTKGYDVHTVIVDNGSAKPFKLEKETESVTLIRSEKNTGFTGGNNIGIRKAFTMKADYILLINNDTLLDTSAIKALSEALEKEDNIGVTVPKIYFAKGHEYHKDTYKPSELGNVFWYAGGYINWTTVMSMHRGVDEVDRGQYDSKEQMGFASGCCMLIKTSVLKTVGLFDDKYFLYFEDADLSERIKRAGYIIQFVPEAKIYHKNASSTGGAGSDMQDYFITRNQLLFGMRYAPTRARLALLRQSLQYLSKGRPNQKKAVKDYFTGTLGKGSYFKK